MEDGYASVQRWTKKVDLFSYSLLLVSATIDMESQSIVYYDSVGDNNEAALHELSNYLLKEHKTKKGSDLVRVEADHWQEDPAAAERVRLRSLHLHVCRVLLQEGEVHIQPVAHAKLQEDDGV